jgi:hypothetical protein
MWQTDAQRSRYRIRYECRRSGPRHGPAAHLGKLIDHVRDATGTMSFIHPSRKTVATTAGEDRSRVLPPPSTRDRRPSKRQSR